MSKYLTKYAVFTKEGMEKVDEIIDREKLSIFMKELDPCERYVLADVINSSCQWEFVVLNSLKRMEDLLAEEKEDEETED